MTEIWRQTITKYFATRTPYGNGALIDYVKRTTYPKEDDLNVCDNNYLNIGRSNGDNIAMSSVFRRDKLYEDLVVKYSDHLSVDSVLFTQSGYVANYSLMRCVAETLPVYIDKKAHASLWPEKGRVYSFNHNDYEQLQELINKNGPGAIVVDSLYSGYGDFCDLHHVVAIKENTGSLLIVDESHSYGIYGQQGRGLLYYYGLTKYADYITVSLAKAFDTRAGLIAGNKSYMAYICDRAHTMIFSSSLTFSDYTRLHDVLEKIIRADAARESVMRASDIVRDHVIKLGFKTVKPIISSPIICIEGSELQVVKWFRYLETLGIITAVFCYPTTPLKAAQLRLTINSEIFGDKLERLLAGLTSMYYHAKL